MNTTEELEKAKAQLAATQGKMENLWDDLADKVASICPDMKGEIAAIRAKRCATQERTG